MRERRRRKRQDERDETPEKHGRVGREILMVQTWERDKALKVQA